MAEKKTAAAAAMDRKTSIDSNSDTEEEENPNFESKEVCAAMNEAYSDIANRLKDLFLSDPFFAPAGLTIDLAMVLSRTQRLSLVAGLQDGLTCFSQSIKASNKDAAGLAKLHHAVLNNQRDAIIQTLHEDPHLIISKNSEGDLALHVGAKAGQLTAVMTLAYFITDILDCTSRHLYIPNNHGDTALHLALQNQHGHVAVFLTERHKPMPYELNEQGISPAYLAIEGGYLGLARRMCKRNFECSLSFMQDTTDLIAQLQDAFTAHGTQLPPGLLLAHAAVRTCNKAVLASILKYLPFLSESYDVGGQTPLSCAISVGFVEGVIYILRKFPSAAFHCDRDGSYPIQKASREGRSDMVEEFLSRFPQTRNLLTI